MESSPEELAGLKYPFYVRKLDKRSRWGHKTDEIEERKRSVCKAIFDPAKTLFSLYQIHSDEDLKRVTIALNASRERLNDQVDYVAFKASEINFADINIIEESPGETDCVAANNLHVDVEGANGLRFLALCSAAIDANREAFRITRSNAKRMAEEMRNYGCLVFAEGTSCKCQQSSFGDMK